MIWTNPSLEGRKPCPTACWDYINTLLRCAARHDVLAILRWALFIWKLDEPTQHNQAQAWIQGDFEDALQSLEAAHTICRPIVSEAGYRRQLESLEEVISSAHQMARKRKEARERRQIWKLAHDQIVDYHASLQDSRFSKPLKSQSGPDTDEVRQKLVREYADKIMVNFGGRAAQERQAKQLVDRLLEEAGGSKFVARQTPVFGDDGKATLIDVMHVAGCPHSYLSRQARIAARLPVPTAVSPSVDSGLTTSDDSEDGIKKGWVPCPHCRPLRSR